MSTWALKDYLAKLEEGLPGCVDSVTFKDTGLTYQNRSNSRYTRGALVQQDPRTPFNTLVLGTEPVTDSDHDPDTPCEKCRKDNGYDMDEDTEDDRDSVPDTDDDSMERSIEVPESESRFYKRPFNVKDIPIIFNISGVDDAAIPVSKPVRFHVYNTEVSYDHRGTDHMNREIPVFNNIIVTPVNGSVSTKDIITAIYCLKNHHFDTWYELYAGAAILEDRDDMIVVGIQFDYGS